MKNPFHPPHDDSFEFEPNLETMGFGLMQSTGADIITILNKRDDVRYVFERVPENPADDCRWWCVAYAAGASLAQLSEPRAFDGDLRFPVGDRASLWLENEWEKKLPFRPSLN